MTVPSRSGRSPLPSRPLIGVLHLPPSLGYPEFPGIEPALDLVRRDVEALVAGGADGVLVENDNDKPHTILVNKAAVAWLVRACEAARAASGLPIGVGVQRVDVEATLAIAAACELELVRLDVFVDEVVMEGERVVGDPAAVRAARAAVGAAETELWTDVHVKHAVLVGHETIASAAARAVDGGSAAVLVSGDRTGEPPDLSDLAAVREAIAGRARLVIGSGLTPENAKVLGAAADAAVVGTSLKIADRIDRTKVARMVDAWRSA